MMLRLALRPLVRVCHAPLHSHPPFFSQLSRVVVVPRSTAFEAMARSKRKTSTVAASAPAPDVPPVPIGPPEPVAKARRTSARLTKAMADPNMNAEILNGAQAARASPDMDPPPQPAKTQKAGAKRKRSAAASLPTPPLVEDAGSDSALSELQDVESAEDVAPAKPKPKKRKQEAKKPSAKADGAAPKIVDPEAEGDEPATEEEVQAAVARPPPVNSDYVPLPWKGRLGYACLNTYLRNSNPPVFSSRTCRIQSILDHRHPLQHPDAPPHPTKNRPDKEQPPSVARGQAYVESLGLANARDVVKMLRWNDRYGIKFLRLSSEMFPFASHEEYGYKLAPFASEALADAGKLAAQLGHRLTTHPGQFTQLGSPRKQVIDNAIRDLEYHAELLSLLKMPPQQDRDAVMILHLGGVFGDKEATLDRFRTNYARLSPEIKKRLVLENDDVSWSVHDLLPLCEELNIPMVLDFHHHNIIFDDTQIREGTKDIMDLFPRILATWARKNITPKMHYSEPTAAAITPRQRRKHSPRVAMLPPCPPTMDLMIEAKDKEQAVFELMRTFQLPGHELFTEITPHVRTDDNKLVKTPKKKAKKGAEEEDEEPETVVRVADEDVGMGGPEGQVYWPPGKEEWLRPVKRVVKKKSPAGEEATVGVATEVPAEDGEDASSKSSRKRPSAKAMAASARAKEVEKTKAEQSAPETAKAKVSKKKSTAKPAEAEVPAQPAPGATKTSPSKKTWTAKDVEAPQQSATATSDSKPAKRASKKGKDLKKSGPEATTTSEPAEKSMPSRARRSKTSKEVAEETSMQKLEQTNSRRPRRAATKVNTVK